MSQVSYIRTIRRTPISLPNLGGGVCLIVRKIQYVYSLDLLYLMVIASNDYKILLPWTQISKTSFGLHLSRRLLFQRQRR